MSFLSKLTYKDIIQYSIYLLILFFILSKEYIVLNEELLIILSFLAVFYGLQNALSNLLAANLDDRNLQIKKQFLSLYYTKRTSQQILVDLINKKINLNNSLKNYQKLLENNLLEVINNRNLVYTELSGFHTEQLLTTYILKYNLEIRNVYLSKIKEIENSISI